MNRWIFLSEDVSQPARITSGKAVTNAVERLPLYSQQKNQRKGARKMKSPNEGQPLSFG